MVREYGWACQVFFVGADNMPTGLVGNENLIFLYRRAYGGLDKITFSWYYEIVASDTHTTKKGNKMKNTTTKKLNMKSKIAVRWTTNPANLGYDGRADDWKNGKPEIMGMKQAKNFPYELPKRIGQGTYKAISYSWNGKEISAGDIMDVCNDADYKKYENGGIK